MKKAAFLLAIAGFLLTGAGVMMLWSQPRAEAGDLATVARILADPTPLRSADPAPEAVLDSPSESLASPDGTQTPSIPRYTIAEDALPKPPGIVPTSVRIGSEETAPIVSAGVLDNGEMEVPDNVTDVAWYRYGPAPGEPGSAVLAAHVDLAGQGPGVFFGLKDLPLGTVVEVEFSDGSDRRFRTIARAEYGKDDLPTDIVFSRTGSPVLTLITCGGDFNPSIRRYDSNVVVYAVPVDFVDPGGVVD